MVIGFDTLPACDGRTDEQMDMLPMAKSQSKKAKQEKN